MECIDCCASGAGGVISADDLKKSLKRRNPLAATGPGSPWNSQYINPYHVLELRRDATESEIVQSYRKLALWHHPGRGRGKESPEERQRRVVFFQMLSNCYETLMHSESRRRYDMHMKRLERKRLAGLATNSSGTTSAASSKDRSLSVVPRSASSAISRALSHRDRLNSGVSNGHHHHVLVQHEGGVPGLAHSSSSDGSSANSSSHHKQQLTGASSSTSSSFKSVPSFGFFCAPKLTATLSGNNDLVSVPTRTTTLQQLKTASSASRSSTTQEAEIQFTEATVNRLFGGPLAPLHRARNFEPFTDPFLVFERVFGNPVFPRVTAEEGAVEPQNNTAITSLSNKNDNELALVAQAPCHHNHKSSGWTGSAHKEADGLTTVFVSSRIFHDRKITRTETVHLDPETGKAHSEVTVDAEQYVVEPVEEESSNGGKCGDSNGWTLCHRHESVKENSKSPGDGSNQTDQFCHNFQSVYGDALEEFYVWNRELYGACSSYMGCTDGGTDQIVD